MLEFFLIEVERIERKEVPDGQGGVMVTETRKTNTFPTFTRFSHSIGTSVATLRRWATAIEADGSPRLPEFADAYLRAHEAQESLLIEGGLAGNYDYIFWNLAVRNLIGWRSRPEPTDHQAIDAAAASEAMCALDSMYVDLMAQADAKRRERGEA